MSDQPIKLEVKAVKTVHVTHEEQKLPTVLIVLKDTPETELFQVTSSVLDRFIVTDVQPHATKNTVEVLFRNLSSKETIELTRQNVLSPAALDEVLGDTISTLMNVHDKNTDADKEEDEDVSDSHASGLSLTELWENLEPITSILMDNIQVVPEHADQTVHSLTIPLLDAHLAQVLYAKSNSPSFVVLTEKVYAQLRRRKELLLSDCAILDYPYPTSSEFFAATGSLTQKVEGYYPLNIPPHIARELRGEVLSLVVNLSQGSPEALVKAYSYINPVRNGLTAYTNRKNTGTSILTSEDIEMVYFSECVTRLYNYMFPSTIASIIQERHDNGEYFETVNMIDDLFNDDDFASSLNNIMDEAGHDSLSGLSETSTVEEMMDFYSIPITKDSGFPETMATIVPKIKLPILTNNSLISNAESVEETPTNVGDLVIAKLLICAIRYSRLITITEATGATLNPIACLVFGLTYPDELEVWASIESVRRLVLKGGLELFTEVYTAGLTNPNLDDKYSSERQLLETGLTNILHRLGHTILSEDFTLEEIDKNIPDNETLISFVSHLVDESQKPAPDSDEMLDGEDGFDACTPIEATMEVYQLIDFKQDGEEFVKAVGDFLFRLAHLKASKVYPDGNSKDKQWGRFIQEWLTRVIMPVNLEEGH